MKSITALRQNLTRILQSASLVDWVAVIVSVFSVGVALSSLALSKSQARDSQVTAEILRDQVNSLKEQVDLLSGYSAVMVPESENKLRTINNSCNEVAIEVENMSPFATAISVNIRATGFNLHGIGGHNQTTGRGQTCEFARQILPPKDRAKLRICVCAPPSLIPTAELAIEINGSPCRTYAYRYDPVSDKYVATGFSDFTIK